MGFKAFLFDMNGVLVNDEHLQGEAFRRALSTIRLPLTTGDYIKYFIGKTDRNGLEDFFVAIGKKHNTESLTIQKGKEYQILSAGGIF